jgi:hypothetical protein
LATLKLDATLQRDSGPLGALFDRQTERKPIQGILAGSNLYVLLLHLIPNGATASAVGPSSEAWIAHRCLTSPAPFSPTTARRFLSLELPLAGFEEWLGLKSIIVRKSQSSITARYVPPRKPKWRLKVGNLLVKFELSHPPPAKYASASFRETPSLVFELKAAVDLDEALSLLIRLQDLLILFTDFDRPPEFPTLRATRDGPPIRLYYTRLRGRSEQLHWHHCWMRFPELNEYFGKAAENWLDKQATIGPGLNLYFASRREQLYAEHRFATLVWGLESLHRRVYPAQPNTALQIKIDRIVEQIERPKDKKWARSQLQGARESTLATRLRDIFEKLPLDFDPAKMETFTQEVAHRRNDLSHFGGMRDIDGYDAFIDQVMRFNEALDLFYHAILLIEIGIPKTAITWWFMNGFRSYQIGQSLKVAGIPLRKANSSKTKTA